MSRQHNRPLDFWREYLKRNLSKVRFLWSLKQDGYQVRLTRGENGTWSIHTRRTQLHPPDEFLQGLEKNKELPNVMLGELITCFTGCSKDARKCKFTRTLERNKQFAWIHKVMEKQDQHAWDELRIVLFAFPTEDLAMVEAYAKYREIMQKTFSHHPHIGMCKFGNVRNTQHAIEIFQSVVQMGFEGIVIVHGEESYDSNLKKGTCFKLKPKEVQEVYLQPFTDKCGVNEVTTRFKDGQNVREYSYKVQKVFIADIDSWPHAKFVENVRFLDMQPSTSVSEEWQLRKVKWMEFVPESSVLCPDSDKPLQPRWFKQFPCIQGLRHMHFATREDVSVVVPVNEELTKDSAVQDVLQIDDNVKRIRNWNCKEDRESLLETKDISVLFNPRPFRLRHEEEEPGSSIPEPEAGDGRSGAAGEGGGGAGWENVNMGMYGRDTRVQVRWKKMAIQTSLLQKVVMLLMMLLVMLLVMMRSSGDQRPGGFAQSATRR